MSSAPDALEPISPELALVCPELAAQARRVAAPQPWQLVAPRGAPGHDAARRLLPLWAAATLYLLGSLAVRVTSWVVAIAALVAAAGLVSS